MDWKQAVATLLTGAILGVSGVLFVFQERISKLEARVDGVAGSAPTTTRGGVEPSAFGGTSALLDAASESTALAPAAPAKPIAMVYGPTDGSVPAHEPGRVSYVASGVSLNDFAARVRFFNPPADAQGKWSYGIALRSGAAGEYRIEFHSDGTWVLHLATTTDGQTTFRQLARGMARSLQLSRPGHNDVYVSVKDASGYIAVNDRPVSVLNFPMALTGEIYLANSLDQGDMADQPTRYEGFSIYTVQ